MIEGNAIEAAKLQNTVGTTSKTPNSKKKRGPRDGIFERYSGVWYIRYVDARGRRRSEKAGPKSFATALYRRRKTEVMEGKLFPENLRRQVKFATIAQDAIDRAEKLGRNAGRLLIVKDWFQNRNAADITPLDIERKLNELADRKLAVATINRFRAALSVVYTIACRNGKVLLNPARLVSLRKENNARVRFLQPDEEKKVREKVREGCPDREPELDLALHTGMRRGEQYSLRWETVDLLNRLITISKSKHGGARHIDLNADAMAALAKLRLRGSEYVCPGGMTKEGYWARWFKDCVGAAGINNFRWHDLRHTFASRLVMAGVDLPTVKELMGHKTIQMTLRYSHLTPGHRKDAVERIATHKPKTGAIGYQNGYQAESPGKTNSNLVI